MNGTRTVATPEVRWVGAGVLVFGMAAVWATISAAAAGVPAAPRVLLIVSTGLAVGVSWSVGLRWPTAPLAALVAGGLLLIAVDPAGVFRGGATQRPLGYANATAAFYGTATIAALLLMAQVESVAARVGAAVAAVVFVAVVVISRSWAVILLLPTILVATVVATRVLGARAGVVVCASVFVGALVVTQLIGASRIGTGEGLIDRTIQATLSVDRVLLWHEAIEITAREPLLGVGPGNFASTSAIARADPDLRWAHQEFLQSSAETGIPGYVFVVAIFAWGFAMLWVTADSVLTAIAAAGLALVGAQATMDYILHFPAVPIAIAVVVGTGISGSSARDRAASPLMEVVR